MIKVFNATDKNYATHGDLILQPSKAVVHKEDNGDFYLDLETPLNEKEYKNTTPEEGQTAEGTSFSITADLTKQYQVQTLKGQTTQTGTPTPTSPQPINITTGRQVVRVCGKNLLNMFVSHNAEYSTTIRGITFTLNENGSITINGTNDNTGVSDFYVYGSWGATTTQLTTTENCTFSTSSTITNGNINAFIISESTAVRTLQSTNASGSVPANTNITALLIRVLKGQTINNITLNLQLEKGTATTYEEYKGQDYEINLGKNLMQLNNITGTTTTVGVKFTKQNDGSILIDGTSTSANDTWVILSNISYKNLYGTPSINIGQVQQSVKSLTQGDFTLSASITNGTLKSFSYNTNNDATACLIGAGASFDNAVLTVQLEKGQLTSYSPYKTPIYLGKIGTYQDYIFKNTIDSPYYDSNLELDSWYLHKEIGRVVFTGASDELWTPNPTWDSNYTQVLHIFHNMDNWKLGQSNYLSNYFKGTNESGRDFTQEMMTCHSSNASLYAFIDYSNLSGVSSSSTQAQKTTAFKNWLSTHNTEVYYILNTPTNTLIEDEELINQLESIELLDGLNNVSVSSADLPAILQLKYNFTTAYSNVIKYIDYLVPNNILVANTPQGDQAFRITNIEKTRRKIKLKANHVFYDSMNYLIADSYVVDKNCNDALDHLNNATSDLSPFTTISNITSINSYRCVRKSLYEAIQVVLERWGGHLVRNDWTLGIYDTIGQDNGVTIRYAKNLKDISATYDWNNVVTKLLPVGKDGILLNAIDPDESIYVESATQYDIPYTKTVSFEQNSIVEDDYKDEEGTLDEDTYKQALVDDLHSQAMEYITNNYLPKVNYKLSANVEKVSDVGDSVEVIDEKLGINLMTNIISFDYDCILERYTQIEFGNFKPTLSNLMTQITVNTEEQITANNQTLQITLNQELETATDKIWDALGNSYVIYEGDKILVVDTLPKEAATNVIMINNGGIAFSNTGINGTFSSAWTIDNVLNMEQINVINLTADLVKGGTLKLGSNLNQNGQIEVYDETNALIAELNKDGLKMYGADGSYVLMNNDVGFAGYDKNDNKIYWVDKDEFHMKKSVIEEEITLCNKMRFIPITIRDNNNNIINDGIGLVSVMGGEE